MIIIPSRIPSSEKVVESHGSGSASKSIEFDLEKSSQLLVLKIYCLEHYCLDTNVFGIQPQRRKLKALVLNPVQGSFCWILYLIIIVIQTIPVHILSEIAIAVLKQLVFSCLRQRNFKRIA